MQEILLKICYFKKRFSKILEKGNFMFSFELTLFNRVDYKKQKRPRTSDQKLFRLQNNFRKIPLLVM